MAASWQHKGQTLVVRGLIGLALALPYRWRVPLFGWVVARLVAPVAGWPARIRANLALAWPDLPAAEVDRLCRAVPDSVGRTVIEIFSGPEFIARAAATPPVGDGVAALEAAHAAGRPVVLVTGHFGNYDASRAALIARGYRVGALYMPMTNPEFNRIYEAAIGRIGQPIFPRGAKGLGALVRHLRSGGMVGMLVDHNMDHGAPLRFFGVAAKTALSAAELALKYDALLVPTYGVRRADGLGFDIVVETPIPPGTPEAMTQALNDSLEALVRRHPDQWFWVQRRWTGGAGRAGEAVGQPPAPPAQEGLLPP
ncbi:MAG: lauroyl acyltransferase [Cypionkella sp.]|nr:lauroyl acyltransferase [Cypionkella sp.]